MAKIVIIICTLIVSCLCLTEENESNNKGLITFLLKDQRGEIVNWMVSACKKNNSEIEGELERELLEALSCLSIDIAGNLSRYSRCADLKTRVESCLEQKYLPQFVLDFVNEKGKQGYSQFISESFDALVNCSRKMNSEPVEHVTQDCITRYDNGAIPPTRTEFCKLLILATKCPIDGVKNNCDITPTVTEAINRYKSIYENIC